MHFVGHHLCHKVVLAGILQSDDLGILKAMIDKGGSPPSSLWAFIAVADVDVCRLGIAEVLTIECSVVISFLGIDNADGVALLSTNTHLQPTSDVLTNIYFRGE